MGESPDLILETTASLYELRFSAFTRFLECRTFNSRYLKLEFVVSELDVFQVIDVAVGLRTIVGLWAFFRVWKIIGGSG